MNKIGEILLVDVEELAEVIEKIEKEGAER